MWNQDTQFEDPFGTIASSTVTSGGRGWFGTAGGGCDYQVSSSIVIGVLADWDFGDIKGQLAPADNTLVGNESDKWAWAVGGRIGWLVTPTFLTYVSAGYTEAHFDQVDLSTVTTGLPSGFSLPAQTYPGWFFGSGFEYALSNTFIPLPPGIFLRTEYRYSTFKDEDLQFFSTSTGVPFDTGENSKKYVQTVRTSLVWRFNMFH
jgi:outer membrane immunogenic protein